MAGFRPHFAASLGLVLSSVTFAFAQDLPKSSPPDRTRYTRPAIAADQAVAAPITDSSANVFVSVTDVVVAAGLGGSDGIGGTETSIAINPFNLNEIDITGFTFDWPNPAPVWHSTDGGVTWTKRFSIPTPPGASDAAGCPCDQTLDYSRNNLLYGVFLTGGDNDFAGSTTDPTSVGAWAWWIVSGNAKNLNTVPRADQPWLLSNRGTSGTNENVFVAYDGFDVNFASANMHVATSTNLAPPQFFSDVVVGVGGNGVNPGHRLAKDPRNGWMYSLFENCVANCGSNPKQLNYILNRTTDAWSANGSTGGVIIAQHNSTQPTPKFCTVNALLGGINHAAVDPQTGDLFYVYGNTDNSGNNQLMIRRVFDSGGTLFAAGENFVVGGTVNAAIPSVAVTNDGVIGVFFYTCNGIVSGFPQFTTWLAISTDQGTTWSYQSLLTFLSPATDNGNARQRVLGDYVQMKALDNCFYGSFVGNRAAFGAFTAIDDPIFFKACVPKSFPNRNFNGTVDNRSDILWRHNNGTLAIWDMNGAGISSAASPGGVPNNWRIVAVNDFNGDGNADLLWRDDVGNLAIWFMNGTSISSTGGVTNVPNVWQVVAAADFNADGRADLLWRNVSTGDLAIWLMNGTSVIGTGAFGAVSLDWVAEKAADIDGDGKADIQWRNYATGDLAIWFMTGTANTVSVKSTAVLGTVPLSWRLVRLADFNGDARQDFLWRNTDGTVAIWLMNGSTILSSASLGVVPTDWRIVGAGDFNGDGRADILWRNIGSLPNWPLAMWFMNGTSISGTGDPGTVDAAWSVD